MTALKLKGIETNIHYPYNLSELKILDKKKNKTSSPESHRISKEFISLPIYPELNDKKILYYLKKYA